MTIMSHGSKCGNCEQLKSDIRKHIHAFDILATLNTNLSWRILKDNLEDLMRQYDEGIRSHDMVSQPSSPSPPLQPVNSNQKEILVNSFKEISQAQEETKIVPPPLLPISVLPHSPLTSLDQNSQPYPEEPRRFKTTRAGWNGGWQMKCRNIVDDLWSKDDSLPFRDPVLIPNYLRVIDRPMCLSLIRKKLYLGEYDQPSTFHEDIMLIFHNSRIFNTEPNSPFRVMTQNLENYYESHPLLQSILQGQSSGHTANNGGRKDRVEKPKRRRIPKENSVKIKIEKPGSENDDEEHVTQVNVENREFEPMESENQSSVNLTSFKENIKAEMPGSVKAVSPSSIYAPKIPGHPENEADFPALTPASLLEADAHYKVESTAAGLKYSCLLCPVAMIRDRSKIRLHVRRVHFHERFECSQCKSKFYVKIHLTTHVWIYHRQKFLDEGWTMYNKYFKTKRNSVLKSIVVRNPFKKFDLIRALSAAVELRRLPKIFSDPISSPEFFSHSISPPKFFSDPTPSPPSIINPNRNKVNLPTPTTFNGEREKGIKSCVTIPGEKPKEFCRIPIVFQMNGTKLEDILAANKIKKKKKKLPKEGKNDYLVKLKEEPPDFDYIAPRNDSSDEDYTPIPTPKGKKSFKKERKMKTKKIMGNGRKGFKNRNSTIHNKAAQKKNPQELTLLEKSGWTSKLVWNHIGIEKVEKTDTDKIGMLYRCLLCQTSTTRIHDNMIRHFRLSHPKKSPIVTVCPDCGMKLHVKAIYRHRLTCPKRKRTTCHDVES